MDGNFAHGTGQDIQGFRNVNVGRLEFTGPCPEIDSCSTLLIKADVEIDGNLIVDGTITFNGEIDFNIDICNIGKFIHTSTIDANTYNIFNPTGTTCGTVLGETAVIKTVMNGQIPTVQFTCDNGVGTDPPSIEMRPNNGSTNSSMIIDCEKDLFISAGSATSTTSSIAAASTGDNIISCNVLRTTSNSVAMELNSPGLNPQFSFKVDNNNAFVMQPINSATGEMVFFPQGNTPNPIIANLGKSGTTTGFFTDFFVENINAPLGSQGLNLNSLGTGGGIAMNTTGLLSANAVGISLVSSETFGTSSVLATTITSNINVNLTSNTNNIDFEAPVGIIQSIGRAINMSSTETTVMTSTDNTTIKSTAGNVIIEAPNGILQTLGGTISATSTDTHTMTSTNNTIITSTSGDVDLVADEDINLTVTGGAASRVRLNTAGKLNIAQDATATTSRTPYGQAGDKVGDVIFTTGTALPVPGAPNIMIGFMLVCFEDFAGVANRKIWGRTTIQSW